MNGSDKIFTCKCVNIDVTKCWNGLCVANDENHAKERFIDNCSSEKILINESIKFLSTFEKINDQDLKDMINSKVLWYRDLNLVINKGE